MSIQLGADRYTKVSYEKPDWIALVTVHCSGVAAILNRMVMLKKKKKVQTYFKVL